ncbi:MAG: ABC transporter ATP-binding protein [Lachnospiraceae bacterium]|nr:ABC transporter ATP-binding protein [Lachnospiraceae bacterium]
MAPILELQDFHYYYGNIHTVKGINMTVNEGEMVTIIGANGAGKTTTLQSISGLKDGKGIRGKIIYDGKEIQGLSGHKVAARGLCQVLEGRHVFSKLTVEENLMTGAYLRKDAKNVKSDMQDIFRRFPRLEERRNQLAGTLSGGEQQMLAIGRALINRPKLMLLDEPSLGLAPVIVKEVFKAIREINKDGMTILFVEQNSKIALNTANRGYVMQVGEVAMEGYCKDLLVNEEVKKAYLGG